MLGYRAGLFMYFYCPLYRYLRTANIVSTKRAESLKLHCGKVSNTSRRPAGVDTRSIQCRLNDPQCGDIRRASTKKCVSLKTTKYTVINGKIETTPAALGSETGRDLSNTSSLHGIHDRTQFPHPMQLNLTLQSSRKSDVTVYVRPYR